jgi:hypothetical protein
VYVVVPAVPDVGVIVGEKRRTGAGEVYVTEPLPVLELVLSTGDVDGGNAGVRVEKVPVLLRPE